MLNPQVRLFAPPERDFCELVVLFEELDFADLREVPRLFPLLPRNELDLVLVPVRPRLPAVFLPTALRPDFFATDFDRRTPTRLA